MAIRVCDGSLVRYVVEEDLSINQLEIIFRENKSINVCLTDSDKKYQGFLTYYTLKEYGTIERAIVREYVRLDSSVWNNAYHYLKIGRTKYVPIVDLSHICVCFAYNDDHLNIVLRYTKMLQKCKKYLRSMVEWEEWKGINLIGLNEVTYEVFLLLKDLDERINLIGSLWEGLLLESSDGFSQSYRNLIAEDNSPLNYKYDFIFKWYRICYVHPDRYKYNPDELKGKSAVVECTMKNVEKICSILLDMNLDIMGLCIAETDRDFIWNYPVIQYDTCLQLCREGCVLFTEKENELFEKLFYEGKVLGREIILLSNVDMGNVQISILLKNKRIGLTGDICLCQSLYKYFVKQLGLDKNNIFYLNIFSENIENTDLKKVEKSIYSSGVRDQDIQYFIVDKSTMKDFGVDSKICIIRKQLEELGIKNISDYFLGNFEYLKGVIKQEYHNNLFMGTNRIADVKKVIVGCSKSYSGNFFISDLLDGHPASISVPRSYFHNLLWYYSLHLFTMCEVKDMMEHLKKMYTLDLDAIGKQGELEELFPDWDKFAEGFLKVLYTRKNITLYVIFTAIHWAYYYMHHGCFGVCAEPWIYWEPHRIRDKEKMLFMLDWFRDCFDNVIVLKVVRDPIRTLGASIRDLISCNAIQHLSIFQWAVEEEYFHRYIENLLVFRFEDLKCKSEKVLRFLCRRIGIDWSDNLLHTTRNGKSAVYSNGAYNVKDFDLKPVYNKYTEYFSEFDYYRLEILFYHIRHAYGYDAGNCNPVEGDRVWELMQLPFKFESLLFYTSQLDSSQLRNKVWSDCYAVLNRNYTNDSGEFYDYEKF